MCDTHCHTLALTPLLRGRFSATMTATYQSMAGLDLTSYYGKKVNTIDGVPWKDAVEDPTTHAPYLTCDTLT